MHRSFLKSRYAAIRDMELDYLCDHYRENVVIENLQAMSADIANGNYPFSGQALGLLLSHRLSVSTRPAVSPVAPVVLATPGTVDRRREQRFGRV